ncbi:hypothetical protein C2G38_1403904 [Gigaspora rosea]|uniref:Attractin/MKLN-like beta-propeller domain-containing protein n=1 Tax=Gigaspora rosea TaxID=44941 RepID=A0A397VCK0_9GLOM|nr:hypothetical protein C2G38_1403904 [Gigaspora rosea]
MGIPSEEVLAASCLSSIDNSTVFLIGGQALDQTKQNIINAPLVYTFNSITSQWNTINTTGFYNYSITLVRMQAVMYKDGKIYIFGGKEVDYTVGSINNGPFTNKMNVLDAKTLTWTSLNLNNNVPTPRVSYTATLLNNSLIIYIGGYEMIDSGRTNVNMSEIQIFDLKSLSWSSMQINGDTIASRNAHSAVLTNDGRIIIFGGNSANDDLRRTTLRAQPDVAVLNTNILPYKWTIPNIPPANSPQSLCYHSAEIYNNIMIIAFGIVTSDQLQTNSSFNNNIYLFDVQNYTWISSITPTSIILTSTTEKTSSNNSSNIMAIEIGIGVSGFIIILCMIIAGFSYYKYRKLRKAIVGMPGTNSYPIETPGTEFHK